MVTCMRIKPVKAMQKDHWSGLIALFDEWFNTTTHDTTLRISNLQLQETITSVCQNGISFLLLLIER